MRLIGLIVSGALAVAVVAEGAYIVHTRRQVDRLSSRLETISQEAADPLAGLEFPRAAARLRDLDQGGGAGPGPASTRTLPPPRLIPSTTPTPSSQPASATDDPLPLPPAIDTKEGREQLRRFVIAALDRERDENRLRAEQRQTEREQARRQRLVTELGLSPSEGEKFNQILSQVQNARDNLRNRMESGELPREAIGRDMAAVRDDTEKQLRSLLGDERMKKYEEMRGGGRGPAQGGDRSEVGAGADRAARVDQALQRGAPAATPGTAPAP